MSRSTLVLMALLLALVGVLGGYYYGHAQGVTAEAARRDATAVQQLTGLIDSHRTLIDQATAASRAMREATAERAALDTQTTEEFVHALSITAGSRAGCRFDAGVLRQLAAARERAAQAAAGGVRHPLPGPRPSASQPAG